MGNASGPNDDPNTSKTAKGEEKTPQAESLKVDFVPPLAPLRGADKVLAEGDDINATAGEAAEEHQERMARYKQLLTPLPPNASLDDIEKRRTLLEEQAAQIAEQIGRAHV